jgi:hypothetical protein
LPLHWNANTSQSQDDVIGVLWSGFSYNPELFHVGIYGSSVPLDFPDSTMKGTKTDTIETEEQLRDLIDYIAARHAPPLPRSPILYIDLEGVTSAVRVMRPFLPS